MALALDIYFYILLWGKYFKILNGDIRGTSKAPSCGMSPGPNYEAL